MSDAAYMRIAETIDNGALTAPRNGDGISDAFMDYLKLLYTPEQARVVQYLKMGTKFTTPEKIAQESGIPEKEVSDVLCDLAAKGRVLGFGGLYSIPPIPLLINHHQFYTELREEDVKAAELYQQFFIKDGYYKYYEGSAKGTPLMRTVPVNRAIRTGQKVLDTEEAHKIIDSVAHLRLVSCPCRTRTEKLGIRECKENNPIGFCIMTEASALYFEAAGVGRDVTAEEAKKYLDEMQDLGLVATTENFASPDHTVICLCCRCCCSQLRGRLRWDNPTAVAPANYVAVSGEECVMCGLCVKRCPFGALSIDEEEQMAVADPKKCMGCGVCAVKCPTEAMRLVRIEREKPFETSRDLYRTVASENREGGA